MVAWPSQRCTDPIGPHRCVQLCELSHWPVQCTQPSATTVRGQWLQWLEDEACHVTLACILHSDTPKGHPASTEIFRLAEKRLMSIGGQNSTPDISFAGCGFIGIYHVGVSACLSAYAPHLLQHRILGSSAGALAGAALLGEVPLELMAKNVLEVAAQSSQHSLGAFSPRFNLANILMDGLDRLLPDDIHIRASGRLFVSMTKISDRSNQLVSSFVSKQDLLEALRASSFVPFMSGWRLPRFRGDLVFDGGYTDNLPIFDGFTITVSPFSGDASICPPDDAQIGSLLNLRIPHGPNNSSNSFSLSKENSLKLINAVVPPGVEGMEKLCSQGFEDAMRFLNSGSHIKCANCQAEQIEEDCGMCKVIIEEAATKTLPLEIKEVFAEVAAAQGKATCSGS